MSKEWARGTGKQRNPITPRLLPWVTGCCVLRWGKLEEKTLFGGRINNPINYLSRNVRQRVDYVSVEIQREVRARTEGLERATHGWHLTRRLVESSRQRIGGEDKKLRIDSRVLYGREVEQKTETLRRTLRRNRQREEEQQVRFRREESV